ncbi:MAG TPA: helix-turn-helix transcriptional regulator [Thermomicrobiaceae bacterium]|nr:helix-turn-helix transcriptional regulator [Thermomicrobiaceae bacterium]
MSHYRAMTTSEVRNLSDLGDLRRNSFPPVSQVEVALEMGVSGAYVSLIEHGKRTLTDELIARYIRALTTCRERAKGRPTAA